MWQRQPRCSNRKRPSRESLVGGSEHWAEEGVPGQSAAIWFGIWCLYEWGVRGVVKAQTHQHHHSLNNVFQGAFVSGLILVISLTITFQSDWCIERNVKCICLFRHKQSLSLVKMSKVDTTLCPPQGKLSFSFFISHHCTNDLTTYHLLGNNLPSLIITTTLSTQALTFRPRSMSDGYYFYDNNRASPCVFLCITLSNSWTPVIESWAVVNGDNSQSCHWAQLTFTILSLSLWTIQNLAILPFESPSGWNPHKSTYHILNVKYVWVWIWVTDECTQCLGSAVMYSPSCCYNSPDTVTRACKDTQMALGMVKYCLGISLCHATHTECVKAVLEWKWCEILLPKLQFSPWRM